MFICSPHAPCLPRVPFPAHARSSANDTVLEAVKQAEELELLRVQLDAARKEAEAQRKRAAAIEVRGCAKRAWEGGLGWRGAGRQ